MKRRVTSLQPGSRRRDSRVAVTIVCGLLAGTASADEPEVPDMAFLEYLGSWQESDEDWMLFADDEAETEELPRDEKSNGTETAPQEEKVAEVDDEN